MQAIMATIPFWSMLTPKFSTKINVSVITSAHLDL